MSRPLLTPRASLLGPLSLRARWVFPVDRPPVENGVVEIADGRIAAIHDRHDPRAHDLGNVALLPGLVNVHTHLEFSDLAAPLQPASPFAAWIRLLVTHRRGRAAPMASIVERGLNESRAAGVAAIGEIATADAVVPALRAAGARGVVFRELLGLLPEQLGEQVQIAERHLSNCELHSSTACGVAGFSGPAPANESDPAPEHRPLIPSNPQSAIRNPQSAGLSPHAPYSVHPDLFHRLVELAARERVPLAIHLAETPAELELLDRGTGELVEMLQAFGVWRSGVIPRGTRPMDYLHPLVDVPRALVVHGNYLAVDEIDFLARHPHLATAYCPRTHAFFGHPPHPWLRLLERGASVALGTDSRASNPDLSLWREMQFLRHRFPQVNPALLLELGTIRGARALGWENEFGTLTPGKLAEFAVAPLRGTANDPYATLFET